MVRLGLARSRSRLSAFLVLDLLLVVVLLALRSFRTFSLFLIDVLMVRVVLVIPVAIVMPQLQLVGAPTLLRRDLLTTMSAKLRWTVST